MIPVNKIKRSGQDVRKMYCEENLIRKAYRNGQLIFQYVTTHSVPPPILITSITFENVLWVTDIPANGGTANKSNCSYQVIAHKSDGTTKDITNIATVLGSLVVSASTSAVRQSAGTLTLTATYDALTANTNVVVYQLGNKIRNYTYYKALSAQTVSFTSGGTFYYTYNLATPYSAATGPIEFGTSGKETVYIAGNNTSPIGNVVFGNNTSMVTVGGSINGLFTCFTTATIFPTVSVKALYSGCTALNRVSSDYLRATTVGKNGYESLFAGCSNMVKAPELPATKLNFACYYQMFKDCTSLVNAPALSAATATYHSCYRQMFQGCTALTNAPALTATTLAQACYTQMFSGCTSLINAPALPATELRIDCYQQMFKGCSNMVKAPELPASTLVQGCYINMFEGCSKLNEIHCSATDISASACTYHWVKNVASAGTFYSYANVPWEIDSSNGIPEGWTPKDIDIKNYTYFKANSAQTVSFSNGGTFYYSYGRFGHYMLATGPIEFGTSGKEMVFVAGNNSTSIGNVVFGNNTSMVTVGGSINGLYECHISNNTTLPSAPVKALYSGCTALKKVVSGYLPATTVGLNAYESLFAGCSNLIEAPALPATALNFACYWKMFKDCTSLVNAPALSAATATYHSCYRQMFECCTSLVNAPALPSTKLSKNCYTQMFSGCTSLVNAPALPATELRIECYAQMFRGCSNMVKAPELPASTLATYCYTQMFEGCSKLNEIHCSATNISASACTYHWANQVASAGTFYGKTAANWPTGTSGIPEGWTKHLS